MSSLTFQKKNPLDFMALTFFACLLSVPFFMIYRTQPSSGYIIESTSIILVLLMTISLVCQGKIPEKIPRTSYFFVVLAAVWLLQSLILPLKFVGQSYFAIAVFLTMALLAFSVRALVQYFGRDKVLFIIAVCLMSAALLQAAIALLQYLNIASTINKLLNEYVSTGRVLLTPRKESIYGQLAQKNHFAHFLMWGVASTIYLCSVKKIKLFLGIPVLFFLGFFLGSSGSRTVLMYLILFVCLGFFWFLRERRSPEIKRALFLIVFTTIILFLFQSPFVMDSLGVSDTGLSRMMGGGEAGGRRVYEWRKAWMLFQAHPFYGVGWTQYSSAAFGLDGLAYFDLEPKESGLFTHCHNIVLQLLAEMGLVGALSVFVGFIWVIFPYYKEKVSAHSLFPLMLISVSFAHSMLEYPLWYVYFLAPFVVFLSVQDVDVPSYVFSTPLNMKKMVVGGGVLFCSVLFLIKACLLLSNYFDLKNVYALRNDSTKVSKIKAITQPLIKKNSFLAYEATYTLELAYNSIYNKKTANVVKKEYWDINQQMVDYRPFSYPMLRRVIYLNDQGNSAEATKVLAQTNRYYETLVPGFLSTLNNKKENSDALRKQTYEYCQKLKQTKHPEFNCKMEK